MKRQLTMTNVGFKRRLIGLALVMLYGCSPADMVNVETPSDVVDPATVTNADGATKLYNYAVGRFAINFGGMFTGNSANFLVNVGVFTDELQTANTEFGTALLDNIDERTLTVPAPGNAGNSDVGGFVYQMLHATRVNQQQGREALQLYAPNSPKAWQGRLYAQEAFTVLWFAEVFCSGIPVPSVPLVGTPAQSRGLTTKELFERAIVLFDSAALLGADSARFANLSKVGKGRALLGLGKQAEAAVAVQGVPTDFVYNLSYGPLLGFVDWPHYGAGNLIGTDPRIVQVVDGEGGNGLVWSADPRTAVTTTPALSGEMLISGKYSVTAGGTLDPEVPAVSAPIRLADGLEARLIEAEADLAAGGAGWLTTLNSLRSTCIGSAACAPVPGLTAGSLPPLSDPGSPRARLDLLMTERAMWLFLTGHRQGDLRRLARVYGRDVATLWPTGTYSNPGFSPNVGAAINHGIPYGTDIVLLPARDEQVNNPLYSGCYDKDA